MGWRDETITREAHTLPTPTLVPNGDDDVLIPTSRSRELLRGIAEAELVARASVVRVWGLVGAGGGEEVMLGGL